MHKFVSRTAASIAAHEVDCSEQNSCDIVFPPIKEELTYVLPADGDVCVKQEPITEELNELCSCTGLCQQVKEEITIEEHPAAPVFLYRSVPASEGGDNYRRAPRCPRQGRSYGGEIAPA
ncbi:uncharacterized protein LOC134536595 isoform X5 [Bacillus rossius redtenbacheri]|uniref:uncharacterized protein LOC134536595 isoform X5 n=1 Tax=Bacillus rossius redtenbacheri TaxID=93214 RepID=UPI002FDD6B4C